MDKIKFETYTAKKAKRLIYKEIKKLSNLVGITFGPGGQVVMINDEKNNPHLTKDGVSIAEFYQPIEEKFKQIINIFKSIAIKTNQDVGDGTTTSILLAFGILKKIARKTLYFSKSFYTDIIVELEKAEKQVLEELDRLTIPIKENDIYNVINIATNGDKELTPIIDEAIRVVGTDGSIVQEESHTKNTYLEIIDGFQYKSPIFSKYFITDKALVSSLQKDSRVFIYNGKADVLNDIMPILQFCSTKNYPLVIIAEEFSQEIIEVLLINLNKNLSVIPIVSVGYGDFKTDLLEDLAMYLGGKMVSKTELDVIYNNPTDELNIESILGKVNKVVSDFQYTSFYKEKDEEKISIRIDEIKRRLKQEHDPRIRNRLQERISLLSNSLAVIKVGGLSEFEVKEKIDRVDDAIKASKAAIESGIIYGGGVTLYNLNKVLTNNIYIKNVLLYPVYILYKNKGLKYKKFLRMKQKSPIEAVYNLECDIIKYEKNALDAGIIIPAKVMRSSIENSFSIVKLLLNTGGTILKYKE